MNRQAVDVTLAYVSRRVRLLSGMGACSVPSGSRATSWPDSVVAVFRRAHAGRRPATRRLRPWPCRRHSSRVVPPTNDPRRSRSMSTHPRRRLTLALALAGTLAGGALAGPPMAASDADSPAPTVRKAGGGTPEFVTLRKAGGDGGIGYII